jgi:hypothetical protein
MGGKDNVCNSQEPAEHIHRARFTYQRHWIADGISAGWKIPEPIPLVKREHVRGFQKSGRGAVAIQR